MTREEVTAVIHYCQENHISYKSRLAEFGIPEWRFYALLTRSLSGLTNNISKNNEKIIRSILLNGFYSEAFTLALSSAGARVSLYHYFVASVVKLL
jgi:hypothetical protein